MGESRPVRVLIVDDLTLFRDGMRAALGDARDIEVVGEAGSAEEAIRLARERAPHVILLDLHLPDGGGLSTTRKLKEAHPGVEVVALTERLDDVEALDVIEAGAAGYILKDIPGANLVGAVRAVTSGRAVFHPQISRKLLDHLGHLARQERARLRRSSNGLTARELEVLGEVAKGATDQEIAQRLVVTEGTVKAHVRSILRRLGSRNRAQAVALALRKGLLR